MAWIIDYVAECDQCGHVWYPKEESAMTHCSSCKSRQWNSGSKSRPRRPVELSDIGLMRLFFGKKDK